jgi:hypothetical protein
MPCSFVARYKRFGGTCCYHVQGTRVTREGECGQWFIEERAPCPLSLYHSTFLSWGITLLPWRWRLQVPPKRWYLCTELHGVTSQKTGFTPTVLRTSGPPRVTECLVEHLMWHLRQFFIKGLLAQRRISGSCRQAIRHFIPLAVEHVLQIESVHKDTAGDFPRCWAAFNAGSATTTQCTWW